MTSRRSLLIVVVFAILLSACAAGVNPETGMAGPDGDVAGFWLGLWHGLIQAYGVQDPLLEHRFVRIAGDRLDDCAEHDVVQAGIAL